MTHLDLIIDLHVENDRQGPGGDDETRRAIDMARLSRDVSLRVLDIGSGTGAASLVLARDLNARVTAIDAAERFIERLRVRAAQAGHSDRINPVVGRMESLPFPDAAFDLLWCEAAIYNIGFARGLRAWRRLLRPGGLLVVSELTWTTPDRPDEIDAYWKQEYPGIGTVRDNLGLLEQEGYRTEAFFFVPSRCWETDYYDPLRRGLPHFLDRHHHSPDARMIVASEQAEMDLYRMFCQWYGYAFYIARKPEDDPVGVD